MTESPQAGRNAHAAGSTDRGQQDADQTEISRTVTGKPRASKTAAGKTKISNVSVSKAPADTAADTAAVETTADTTAAGKAEDYDTEVCNTAALLTKAKAALEQFIDVKVDDDGALSFQHAGVPGAVQAVQLAEGLVVLSLTCVVAWDVPAGGKGAGGKGLAGSAGGKGLAGSAGGGDLTTRLAMRAGEGLFGTLGVVRTKAGYDITLRYAFPAAGLEPAALGTLLMLVISTASQLRSELLPT